jgi:AcrR family transcriptional regulator
LSDVTDPSLDPTRPVRADARRNRELLVATARTAFAASAGASVSLEGIAKTAGVGIGTLYRHFPTREALVEAVYRSELDAVTAQAAELLGQHRPDRGLRLWLDRYADFVAAKTGIIDTLRAGWASGAIEVPTTRQRVNGAIAGFLEAGATEGVLRDDVGADDVTALLLGVFLSATASGAGGPNPAAATGGPNPAAATGGPNPAGDRYPPSGQTARLLDLLVDALRPRPGDDSDADNGAGAAGSEADLPAPHRPR